MPEPYVMPPPVQSSELTHFFVSVLPRVVLCQGPLAAQHTDYPLGQLRPQENPAAIGFGGETELEEAQAAMNANHRFALPAVPTRLCAAERLPPPNFLQFQLPN